MTFSGRYQYVCHSCGTEHTQVVTTCQKCSLVGRGRFKLDPQTEKVNLICDGCGEPQSALDRPPLHCVTCHQGTLDWWDEKRCTWFNLDLAVSPDLELGIWICGDFDGDYEGVLKPDQGHLIGLTGQGIFYDIQIKHGYLKNVRKVAGPPLLTSRDEIRPFTEPLLFPVDVQTGRAGDIPSGVSRVGLKSFRLHRWQQAAENEGAVGGQIKRYGRLMGVAYGVLDESSYLRPEEPERLPIEDPGESSTLTHPSSPPEVEQEEESGAPKNNCLICTLLFQFLLFGLTWLACTLKVAGLFWLFMSVACWLDSAISRKGLRITNKWVSLGLGLLLMLASGGGLTVGYWPSFIQDCQLLSQNALLISAGALLLGALLRSCFVKTTLLIFVFIALSTWCKTHDRACKFIPATSSFGIAVDSLIQQAAIVLNSDVNSALINDAGQNNSNGQRISLDQANHNIELLDNCKNRIYIPFGFNSSELDPETVTKLYRLGQLLKRYAPERIIISGYTSKNSGDETPQGFLNNIKLSKQRTETVRRYLVSNEFIDDNKIETRGYGHNVPILPRSPAHDINRRVEVNIQCPLGKDGKE